MLLVKVLYFYGKSICRRSLSLPEIHKLGHHALESHCSEPEPSSSHAALAKLHLKSPNRRDRFCPVLRVTL